jgi:hypothetical protein
LLKAAWIAAGWWWWWRRRRQVVHLVDMDIQGAEYSLVSDVAAVFDAKAGRAPTPLRSRS